VTVEILVLQLNNLFTLHACVQRMKNSTSDV
jgi:hypothetical protein